ncbi:hypothetical protein DYI24_00740 [Rhodopseudomonas sp. BR0C11]|uniref:hypothetical protein n=1 Tax=Rhodopseudomonas sp. BR0C11 TaxID=2269370 RepID=UPI0013DF332E|nr:hypothetical protein [Rhodopseudomonas sp. BR0C11]NEV75605.1 hypothetical protein [Rhodopseudomonas sp. BR0C11]
MTEADLGKAPPSDLAERLRAAAHEFEETREWHANCEDADCTPHQEYQVAMSEASKAAIEGAQEIARMSERDQLFDEMVEALRPFAKAADQFAPVYGDRVNLGTEFVTVGHLRAARAIFAKVQR